MFNLLQADIKMFKNNQMFWGLIIFSFLFYLFGKLNYINYNQQDQIRLLAKNIISLKYFAVSCVIVNSIFTNDIKNRVINNTISTGKYIWQIYFGKVITLMVAVVVFQITSYFISRLTYYIIQTDFSDYSIFIQLLIVVCDCLYMFMFLGICILINIITFSFSKTIVFSGGIFAIISTVETFLNHMGVSKNIMNFFPNYLYASVFINPFTKESILNLFFVCLLVFTITVLTGYFIFRMKDFQ